MIDFIIIFAIAFTVFAFLALVLYFKDRPGKPSASSCACGSSESHKTGCTHCSEQIRPTRNEP